MLLRTKVFLAITGIGLALSAFFFYVWIPRADANAREVLERHAQSKLSITAEVLIPLLIQNQYANIYESMDALLATNSDWVSVELHDGTGSLIYPLTPPSISTGDEHLTVVHDIKIRGSLLGSLTLTSDLSKPLRTFREQNFRLFQLFVIGLFVGLAAIMVLLDLFVRRPAKNLSYAAEQLSKGDYTVSLPTPTKDEIGKLTSSFKEMRDAIQDNEASLRTAKEQADKANMAKSEFLSSMSHELRTPLNAILGFAQVLELNPDPPLNVKQKAATGHIIRGGQHLLDLINDVLNLAQIESGRIDLSIERVETHAVIDECISMVKTLTHTPGVSIDADGFTGSVIQADRVRFKQVLFNLMSNAVKYNREGGKVSVASAVTDDGMQRISISDTGHGIPADKQDELFQPFSRLGAENSSIEGTGIGLTITQRLLETMGGRIGFKSTEGVGSTFWVDFPLDARQTTRATEDLGLDAVKDSADECAGKVLYIEDNLANVALMETILHNVPGVKLEIAHTAELGLAMAIKISPDLILMDINLPGMNGIEALAELRRHDGTRHIPAIAISADAMPSEVQQGMEAGFLAYMTKPLDVAELIVTVSGVLSKGTK